MLPLLRKLTIVLLVLVSVQETSASWVVQEQAVVERAEETAAVPAQKSYGAEQRITNEPAREGTKVDSTFRSRNSSSTERRTVIPLFLLLRVLRN